MSYLQNVPGIPLSLRNIQQYNNLSYIYFKIFPLCSNTVLAAIVKVLETLLEAIL